MNQLLIYVICVGLASVVNYVTQEVCFAFWPHIVAAMLIGTAAGLIVKYILVKKYAFFFKARDKSHEARVFFVYGLLGASTTFLFWGIELGFHYYVPIENSRQIGTILGLLVCGYVKFILDRDVVFTSKLS